MINQDDLGGGVVPLSFSVLGPQEAEEAALGMSHSWFQLGNPCKKKEADTFSEALTLQAAYKR